MMKPETAGSSSLASQASSMASLSQAARKRQLRIARNILIFLGIIKIIFNIFFYGNIDAKVNDAVQCQIQQAVKQGRVMQPAEIEQAKQNAMLIESVIWMGALALGVVFVFLGLLVKRFPVPMTVLSLVLYLVTTVAFGILNPLSLMEILLFKFFVVAALMKSIHAAIAYQRAESALERVSLRSDGESQAEAVIPQIRRSVTQRKHSGSEANSEVDLTLSSTSETPEYQPAIRAKGISLEIYSHDSFSKAALVFGFIGVGAMLIGLHQQNAHWSLFALAPWMMAMGNWFFRPARFHCVMNPDGLLLDNSSLLPYSKIQNMRLMLPRRSAASVTASGSLVLLTEEGCLRIPGRLNVPLVFFFRELIARIPRSGSRDLPAGAMEHLRQAEAASGPDGVFSYRRRRFTNCGPATGHTQARALLLVSCGLFWMATAIGWLIFKQSDEYAAWIVFGMLLMFFAFLAWLSERSTQGRPRSLPNKYASAAMIISPAGLFLHQEDLEGFLRWEELRNVVFHAKLKSFAVSSAESGFLCIDLYVDGAVIRVEDIYDRPLALIHSLIKNYWHSPSCTQKG